MSENNQAVGGYGYSEGPSNESSIVFGLNQGAKLTKFEWTPNGGKDGAEQEAIDIIFHVNGRDVSYRKFPVEKAYHKLESGEQVEILASENPRHEAVIKAQTELSSVLVHIVGCFVEKEDIKQALSSPIHSFKDYCRVLQSLLPKDFSEQPLDLFFRWQWQIKGDNTQTYLELPKNMKQGRWCQASVQPQGEPAVWEKQERKGAGDNEVALRYVDGEGNVHPFTRTGWFMESPFSSKQKEESTEASDAVSQGTGGAGW